MKDEIKEILQLIGNCCYHGEISEDKCKKYCNYITNLQEENKILKELNVCVGCNNPNYKSRNEKAIDYITSEESINIFTSINAREKWLKINHKLLNILNGGDDNAT